MVQDIREKYNSTAERRQYEASQKEYWDYTSTLETAERKGEMRGEKKAEKKAERKAKRKAEKKLPER